jgi:hypothetical protein
MPAELRACAAHVKADNALFEILEPRFLVVNPLPGVEVPRREWNCISMLDIAFFAAQ